MRSVLFVTFIPRVILLSINLTFCFLFVPEVALDGNCTGGQTCVDNAFCNNDKCQCNSTYYRSSNVCVQSEYK